MKQIMRINLVFALLICGSGFSQEAHQGKVILGPRLALGAVYGASVGFGGQIEYGFRDDIADMGDVATWLGLGASFAYSTYSEDYFLFTTNGEFTYTNIVFLGSVFFHANLFKNPKLDSYASFSLGVNTGSAKYTGTAGNVSTPTVGAFTLGLGIGTRYYFNPKTAIVGELGIGLGALRLGVDFKL